MIDARTMRMLAGAMREPDCYVVSIEYTDRYGTTTRRKVSPIRFIKQVAMLAMCLGEGKPKRFELERIASARVVPSSEVLLPEAIEEVEPKTREPSDG